MEAFKPGLGKLVELPCRNNLLLLSPYPTLQEETISTQSFTPEGVCLKNASEWGLRGIRNPDLPKIRSYSIYSHILNGVSRMLTQKKEKGKQKHPNEKIKNNRESPASGPQARDGLRKRKWEIFWGKPREPGSGPQATDGLRKRGRGARPIILVPIQCPNNFFISLICSH